LFDFYNIRLNGTTKPSVIRKLLTDSKLTIFPCKKYFLLNYFGGRDKLIVATKNLEDRSTLNSIFVDGAIELLQNGWARKRK
jgi:hypothetical protein